MQGRVETPGRDHHPGLDGLRGIAVAWVVAFHLWPDTVRGGWLGVSLFFTLSGFLVVGLLDAELRHDGRIRLGRFVERRARRLLPAALLTIAGVLVATAAFDDQPLRDIGLDALTAALSVFNWRVAAEPVGYGDIFAAAATPLDHFWSLSIEEQFYLLTPLALLVTRRAELVVAAMLAVGIAGIVVWWGSPDAYVATPVRATEIAVGAALALAAVRAPTVLTRLVWLTPVAVLVSVWAVIGLGPNEEFVFRGAPQLMAVAWAVLVAASRRGEWLSAPLAVAPLRWLGLRSYAIYLVHWPLIELSDLPPAGVIVASLLIAEISYRTVEMPIRRGEVVRRAAPVLLGSAAGVATVAVAVAAFSSPEPGIGERRAGVTELPEWAVSDDPDDSDDATTTGDDDGGAETDGPATPSTTTPPPPIVTVIGDSTAIHIAGGLRVWSDEARSMAVVDRAVLACSPVITGELGWRATRTDDGSDPVFNLVVHDEPCRTADIEPGSAAVLVVDHAFTLADHQRADGSWASILDADLAADVEAAYRELVAEAAAGGTEVIFTTAPRWLPRRDQDDVQPPTEPARAAAYNELVAGLVDELDGAELIDTAATLDASGYDGPYGRSDGVHLDADDADAFAADVVGPALLSLLT